MRPPAPALLAALVLAACAGARPPPAVDPPAPSAPAADTLPPAPWRQPPLPAADVPGVYLAEWSRAANRAACAPLAPASLGAHAAARPRAAYFGGGWGVAYDLPGVRSAFGVAGAGVLAGEPSYAEWPHRLAWSDGGTAGYGPEGGTGPNQLAYLRVPGQDCLYNVWSALGREHLEELLAQLRFVRVPA